MRLTARLALALGCATALSGLLATFLDARLALLAQALLIALIGVWILRNRVSAPAARLAEWMRQILAGASTGIPPPAGELAPLAAEAARMAQSLSEARSAAQHEARLRQNGQSLWTAERLGEHVRRKLAGRPLVVVANREPYMHVRRGKATAVITPASGLVTGIEPILRACGGIWVGHGSGDADRENADSQGKLFVPPGQPQYTLKRVWLTPEEEQGYYYGFSNEGLWPLCHIAHTRPRFLAQDWDHYRNVNRKFFYAVLEELKEAREPYILIQDYHYAVLPRWIKEARPDARVAIFWHIPWPNPEAFGICPWQREILHGMLGADLIGFHVQGHCNNFLETVDAALESRVDWERFAVQREGHSTLVKPYPISIDFPTDAPSVDGTGKSALFKKLGASAEFLGIGVDRVDYTKGILERFRGIERFLQKYPEYRGRLLFVQMAAPSRMGIRRYVELLREVEAEAARINLAFHQRGAGPILLLSRHHSHEEIAPFYRAADFCMVTSLHDGMNLVAKEFVASRFDEGGSLILSSFTGAARELRQALIVNPYDAEQMGESIRTALEMSPQERSRRMSAMRRVLRENNIYLWASRLIDDLTAI